MLWSRKQDERRHVTSSLQVMDYLVTEGHKEAAEELQKAPLLA